MSKFMNRRLFIKNAAGLSAVVVAPTVIPSSALGKAGTVAPSNRITLGCLAVGGKGRNNLRGFLNKKGVQVLAVCDVDKKHRDLALNMVAEKYGNTDCDSYNDFRELLARDDIDAVSQAATDHWHAIMNVYAARAGKDMYAEKPLAYSISEGRAIVDAVDKYGVVFQTGSQQRSGRHFRFACELVRNGYIGEVKNVNVWLPHGNSVHDGSVAPQPVPTGFDYDMWLGPAPWKPYTAARCHWNFRWITDYSGGQITDWSGHHIDIAQWGMNTTHTAPDNIEGKGVYPDPVDSPLFNTAYSYRFVCTYKNGTILTVESSEHNPRNKQRGVLFTGSDGWIYVNRGGIDANPKSLLSKKLAPTDLRLYRSDDHIQNFLDCVKSRQQCVAPADQAHRSITVGHLGLIAMKLGRKITFDPDREIFPNDDKANKHLSRPMRGEWVV